MSVLQNCEADKNVSMYWQLILQISIVLAHNLRILSNRSTGLHLANREKNSYYETKLKTTARNFQISVFLLLVLSKVLVILFQIFSFSMNKFSVLVNAIVKPHTNSQGMQPKSHKIFQVWGEAKLRFSYGLSPRLCYEGKIIFGWKFWKYIILLSPKLYEFFVYQKCIRKWSRFFHEL